MKARRGILCALACFLSLSLSACGDDDSATPQAGDVPFEQLEAKAQGQTVRWWMFGGDQRINDYVDDVVAPAVRRAGFELERVPVADTAEAVQRVVSQKRAGKTAAAPST